MVEKGMPILKLSNPTLEQNILTQEARLFEQINNMENTRLNLENRAIRNRQELMRVELNLRETERQYEKQKVLFERGLTSQDLFESARDRYQNDQKRRSFALETVRQDSLYRINQLAALDTSAKSLQRQLEHVRRPLENLTVRAPIAGQLSQLNAEIGQLMNRGRRIGQVDVLDAYKMRVGIDEFYITRITKGLKGTIEIDDETYDLTIRRVFPEVLEGQFEVDMDFVGCDTTKHSARSNRTDPIGTRRPRRSPLAPPRWILSNNRRQLGICRRRRRSHTPRRTHRSPKPRILRSPRRPLYRRARGHIVL